MVKTKEERIAMFSYFLEALPTGSGCFNCSLKELHDPCMERVIGILLEGMLIKIGIDQNAFRKKFYPYCDPEPPEGFRRRIRKDEEKRYDEMTFSKWFGTVMVSYWHCHSYEMLIKIVESLL